MRVAQRHHPHTSQKLNTLSRRIVERTPLPLCTHRNALFRAYPSNGILQHVGKPGSREVNTFLDLKTAAFVPSNFVEMSHGIHFIIASHAESCCFVYLLNCNQQSESSRSALSSSSLRAVSAKLTQSLRLAESNEATGLELTC